MSCTGTAGGPGAPRAKNDGARQGRQLLGVDVGGTFTDFLFWDGHQLRVEKRPSTPRNPEEAVLSGIREMGWQPEEVVHGSTVATNALLTRRGARTALVTTRASATR